MSDKPNRTPPADASTSFASARRGGSEEAAPVATRGAASDRPRWSNQQLASCAERELRYRRNVYPKLVAGGRMSQQIADRELSQMEAIRQHFADLAGAECPKLL